MYYLQVAMIATSTVLPALATLTVGARFQARRIKNLPLKADDWIILLALIITIADCIGCIYATVYAGVGQVIITLTPETTISYFKFLYADIILDHLTYGLIKISAVLFYRRIFTIASFRRVANIALIIISCWTVAAVLSAIFSAWPISNFWNQAGKTNLDFGVWAIAMAALDVALDLMTLCLPLPIIRNLQISTRRKISLLGIFWLGFFCVATSAVRLYYSVLIIHVTDSPTMLIEEPDRATYIANANTLWARIEACSSIIAACLPTLAPLVQDMKPFDSLFNSLRSIFSKSSSGGVSSSPSWRSSSQKHLASDFVPSQKGWQKLQTGFSTMASRDVELGTVPDQSRLGHGITVHHTVTSQSDQ